MSGEELLGGSLGFEALLLSLSSSDRQVGIFGPIILAQSAGLMTMLMPAVTDPAQAEAMRRSAGAMADNITRSVSPYTAATGDKAREIIDQLKAGHRVIYRTLGANAASTAGEAELGAEFNRALADCGI